MKLKEINFINFRNLKDNNIKFSKNFNLFHGKNGQGKTSVLEAIYFTATGKSFRTSKISELIKYDKDKCGSYVSYEDKNGEKNLTLKFSEKKKEYYYNGERVSYFDYYGKLNIVTFIPEDIELITGSPGIRRKFFDEEISQSDEEYFRLLKDYSKVLKIRNQNLKEKKLKIELSEIYETEFIKLAALIVKKRLEYIKNITIILNLNYRKIFDNTKELSLNYVSDIDYIKKESVENIEKKIFLEIQKKNFLEKKYGYSLVGPQKDEFKFILNCKDARNFSSQGEKKSIVFALKLSEIDMILKEKKEVPIFLIDDISSYFDDIRKESILNYLKKREIQLLISSTSELILESEKFKVENGRII